MIRTLSLALALALPLASTAQSAALSTSGSQSHSTTGPAITQTVGFKNRKAYFSGPERLKRLLRPHFRGTGNVITQSVRDATGNPNIVVFDRRSFANDVFNCSYITYRGKRALHCS